MGQQDSRIQACLGNTYCAILHKEAIGKNADREWCKFKMLYLMLMISPYVGYSCAFDCYLNSHCNC